jgi:hypothetical protein
MVRPYYAAMTRLPVIPIAVLLCGAAIGGYFADNVSIPRFLGQAHGSGPCEIKGSISSDGQRLYHLPGQKYYSRIVVNPRKGEHWFCTEEEAKVAGWRRARF